MADGWCEPDDCPAELCKGPHFSHECDGSIVTMRFDDRCPWCGLEKEADRG